VGAELESAHDQMRRECLGSDSGLISDMCTTSRFLRLGGGRGDGEMASEAELNYYVNDWLFIAPSSTADTFGAIAERHMAYKHALAEVGIHTEWMHFYWAAHVHHALKSPPGYVWLSRPPPTSHSHDLQRRAPAVTAAPIVLSPYLM